MKNDKQQPESHKNWIEDYSHENGQYNCMCAICGHLFIGHKRRVTCRECAGGPEAPLSNETKVVEDVDQAAEKSLMMDGFDTNKPFSSGFIAGAAWRDSQFKNIDTVKVITDRISELEVNIEDFELDDWDNESAKLKYTVNVLNEILKLI